MSIPNLLTFLRLILTPIFLLIYLYAKEMIAVLLLLFALCELSDFLDGYIARKMNQVTELGKILDPMADSIFHISLFLAFTQPPVNLHIVPVFIIIYRECVISTVRTLCALKGYTLAARWSGKIKAFIQGLSAFIVLLLIALHSSNQISARALEWSSSIVVTFAALYTLFSGFEYLIANRAYIVSAAKL